jgi:hypothetical protein
MDEDQPATRPWESERHWLAGRGSWRRTPACGSGPFQRRYKTGMPAASPGTTWGVNAASDSEPRTDRPALTVTAFMLGGGVNAACRVVVTGILLGCLIHEDHPVAA